MTDCRELIFMLEVMKSIFACGWADCWTIFCCTSILVNSDLDKWEVVCLHKRLLVCVCVWGGGGYACVIVCLWGVHVLMCLSFNL